MRNLIRRLKCWYFSDELILLETLVFTARLDKTVGVRTKDWRKWAELSGVDQNNFLEVRHWLEQRGFVSYWVGRYRTTAEGEKWHDSLRKKSLVH